MFVKRLGEKLKDEQIRVFSVDPGGKCCFLFNLSANNTDPNI